MAYAIVSCNKRAITWDQNASVSVSLKSALQDNTVALWMTVTFVFTIARITDDPSLVMSTFLNHSKLDERTRPQYLMTVFTYSSITLNSSSV